MSAQCASKQPSSAGHTTASRRRRLPPPPTAGGTAAASQPQPPQWPRVSQKEGLRPQPLLPDDYLVTVPGCLSAAEAAAFVAVAEAAGFQHSSSRGPAYGEAFRDNERLQVQDERLAETLWRATGLCHVCASLADEIGEPVGLNPNLRFYRYDRGQRFGKHIDESNDLGGGRYTQFTLLIYLSACGGGQTIFYGGGGGGGRRGSRQLAAVSPAPGLALLHRHGACCLEHEGAAVTAGCKYVLRSDVVFQERCSL